MYSGEFTSALEHAMEHTEVFVMSFFFSAMGYFSVVFILLLIKHFGATYGAPTLVFSRWT